MVDVLIFRRRLIAHLLSTSIVLFAWIVPSSAALLKDIRIGEYKDFTRVVFESDTALTTERISSPAPGRLTVVLVDTQPSFVRKIPVDRDRFIEDIQILSQEGRLSINLHLSRRYTRFNTFELNLPPRIVLDIFREASSSRIETRDTSNPPAATAFPGARSGDAPSSPEQPASSISIG